MQPVWKTVWQFLKVLNIELPQNLKTPFLGICPRERNENIHSKKSSYIWLLKTALFIIDKIWKLPQCLSTVEWIHEM